MAFSVIEPHPSVPKTKRANLSTGRGGAGNFSSHDSASLTSGPTASGPASKFSLTGKHSQSGSKPSPAPAAEPRPSASSAKSKTFSSGIGGAGNFHSASDRRIFSFDEELERAQRLEKARDGVPVYHFGRGGAGNLASSVTDKASSKGGSENGRAGSTASTGTESSVESRGARRLGGWIRGLSTSRE